SLVDALWHLLTALGLALPARRWVVAWLAPILALGLDVDHVFGDVLATVTGRTAHDLFLVVLVGGLLYELQGRSAALIGVGAVLAHIGVDGGGFPLLGPISTTFYFPPLAVLILFIGLAAGLFFLAARPLRDLRRPTSVALLGGAIAVVALLFVYLPVVSTFIGQ
ncbi:MAG TPA: hypothetical protein VEY07_00315, partial [Thermoplasmata archaeon]|nr:hypothetical protein [Thermoplasmata archaeon]